jgi:hypothetical protein
MKFKITLILKGMLLIVTFLTITLCIAAADSIYDNGYFMHAVFICAGLYCLCYLIISKEEIDILTFSKRNKL